MQLKRQLEQPVMSEVYTHPSPEVQIMCIRQYIEEAGRILSERGVEYKPTQVEQRAIDFNARLSEVVEIHVVRSGFFAGCKNYIITLGENFQTVCYGYGIEFTEVARWNIDVDKSAFISELEKLYIGEWKSHYPSQIIDGEQWEVSFKYGDGTSRKFVGSNAYPYNFYDLIDLLSIEEEG